MPNNTPFVYPFLRSVLFSEEVYYNMLADRLRSYDDIFLFGSTTAKDELYNKLKSDKHFAGKTINVKSADHLTENQM